MQVETYEVLETDCTGKVECDAAAVELIEKLGLAGQQRLINRAESPSGTQIVRNPYRKMTRDEVFVYSVLCPSKCKIAEYDDGPIPLRVLQVASHAAEHFSELHVWSAESAVVKDPVLVGSKTERKPNRSWDETSLFILARWGDVLEPFDKLLDKAAHQFRAAYKSKADELIATFRTASASVEHCSVSDLFTKSMPSGYS